MTRWLVTGARGQVGSDLIKLLQDYPTDQVLGLGSAELDITDRAAVHDALTRFQPDVVMNAAAFTAVDAAESDEEQAHRVNAIGPENLARACVDISARLVQISTDYVFSGTADRPYVEDDETDPRSAYGRTKLAGERAVERTLPAHYIVRTAWVYGETGSNFVKTMIRLERERETVSVVDDQRGSPTWSADLAGGLVALAGSDAAFGTYHFTNSGSATWYEFARAVFEEFGADPGRILPTSTQNFPRPAPRPAYSVLGHDRWQAAGLPGPREWRPALNEAVAALDHERNRMGA